MLRVGSQRQRRTSFDSRTRTPGKLFQLKDPKEILIQIFQEKKERNQSFSIRAWSRQLGFKNPSYLSEVLRGKTRLQPELAMKIAHSLDIPDDEKKYFEALVFYHNANSESERDFFAAAIKKFRPEREFKKVEENYLHWAKSWVYWPIDEIIFLKDFREDPSSIAKRIGNDVTPQMVELAIRDMLAHKVLERDAKGRLIRSHINYIPERTTLQQQKLYYERVGKKFAELGAVARLTQPPEEVYFRSVARPFCKKDLPKIRKALRDFCNGLREFEPKQGSADEIFALDISFFRLTLGQPDSKQSKEGKP